MSMNLLLGDEGKGGGVICHVQKKLAVKIKENNIYLLFINTLNSKQ